ncbi:hypothetical protein [Acinetobacter rathckeae]|uniref:hypothetical protein n=1 Tax=Acinetobacter rathckeae TaxID=2605272 RepID=UPI0018A2AB20|nr:hypothetical protein [Acinetobacter rathckeae]MBF7696628.1 hypothetical protein [Acinetobacter rathckeae]
MPKNQDKPSHDSSVFCFNTNEISINKPTDGDQSKRVFNGVAYSGGVIQGHWYWENVIFDLDSMQIETPLAALLEHDVSKRVGVTKSFTKDYNAGLVVSGDFLDNDNANGVINDSDSGFPWQMSVFIDPQSIERVDTGEIVVNGQTLKAPITVFRGGVIREISFCVLGADSNTSAVAANHQHSKPNHNEDNLVNELEQAKADLKQAQQERDEAVQALNQFKASKREDDIKNLQSELGLQFSEDDKKAYSTMNDDAFAFTAKQLQQFSAKTKTKPNTQAVPDYLFQHQGKQNDNQQQPQKQQFSLSNAAKDRK